MIIPATDIFYRIVGHIFYICDIYIIQWIIYMSYAYAQGHNATLDQLSVLPPTDGGTLGHDGRSVVVRTPAQQQTAMNVYSRTYIDSVVVKSDGGSMTGVLDMNSNPIRNIADGQTAHDAVSVAQLSMYMPLSGQAGMAGDMNLAGNRIRNLPAAPIHADEAVRKDYVDALAAGIISHQSVVAVCRYNTFTYYNNGQNGGSSSGGYNATLTATSVGVLIVDGVSVRVGDRVLVSAANQTYANGVYVVTAVGSNQAAAALIRAPEMDGAPAS